MIIYRCKFRKHLTFIFVYDILKICAIFVIVHILKKRKVIYMGNIACFETYIKAWNEDHLSYKELINELRPELEKAGIPTAITFSLINLLKEHKKRKPTIFKTVVESLIHSPGTPIKNQKMLTQMLSDCYPKLEEYDPKKSKNSKNS